MCCPKLQLVPLLLFLLLWAGQAAYRASLYDGSSACHVQAALQEFAWTEDSIPERLKDRLALQQHGHKLEKEPMFCLETAMKLQKWSSLAYTKLGQEEFREQRSLSVAGSFPPDTDPEKAEASPPSRALILPSLSKFSSSSAGSIACWAIESHWQGHT